MTTLRTSALVSKAHLRRLYKAMGVPSVSDGAVEAVEEALADLEATLRQAVVEAWRAQVAARALQSPSHPHELVLKSRHVHIAIPNLLGLLAARGVSGDNTPLMQEDEHGETEA